MAVADDTDEDVRKDALLRSVSAGRIPEHGRDAIERFRLESGSLA